ncbi:hypothetical protein GPL15_01005 [Clostridium sp. MCC353]|uniref:AlkZ-related protein n=1 Tax=Clostridium sp. MCC353 TaxID=2592646 RepID=UPI001C013257|nr:hypothetical protein [Clostridium sp. MCC353]MBT9775088.1 hypothetical protein [Clostridium sp. MCC353]
MGVKSKKRWITSPRELEALVQDFGFLPFFKNEFDGFSVEEYTPQELWFSRENDGPWEWKGPVARGKQCAYGKLFRGKAGFVSREWFPDLCNWRRDGYDFDARYEDGLASRKDKEIYETTRENGSMLTKEIKAACGYGKQGKKGFDTIITRLQMQTYLTVADFEYAKDKLGNPYGWGLARYAAPETLFGEDFLRQAYKREPEESRTRIFNHLILLLPDADDDEIRRIIG